MSTALVTDSPRVGSSTIWRAWRFGLRSGDHVANRLHYSGIDGAIRWLRAFNFKPWRFSIILLVYCRVYEEVCSRARMGKCPHIHLNASSLSIHVSGWDVGMLLTYCWLVTFLWQVDGWALRSLTACLHRLLIICQLLWFSLGIDRLDR